MEAEWKKKKFVDEREIINNYKKIAKIYSYSFLLSFNNYKTKMAHFCRKGNCGIVYICTIVDEKNYR
jgi:hypothetical protein